MRIVGSVFLMLALVLAPAPAALALLGDPLEAFTGGPVPNQLSLTLQGQTQLAGGLFGTVYRFTSDDGSITVDVVVRNGQIDQELLYLPRDERRGMQVSMFLQDAVGSIVAAQKGMIAWRAAVDRGGSTYLTWGRYTMRFEVMPNGLLRVQVTFTR